MRALRERLESSRRHGIPVLANEVGHAAFMLTERLRELTTTGVPFDAAVAQVRANSIFTTHTPVPAGHDMFPGEHVAGVAAGTRCGTPPASTARSFSTSATTRRSITAPFT